MVSSYRVIDKLWNVEIDEFENTLGIKQDIISLYITMPNACLVHFSEASEHLSHDIFDLNLREEARSLNAVLPFCLIFFFA